MKIFKISFWLKLLFPITCLNCDKAGETYLCADCFKLLSFHGEVKNLRLSNLDKILAVGSYQDTPSSLLIHTLKFKSVKAVANILAEFLRVFWQSRIIFDSTEYLVIPLPLSKKRQRQRGFNQAEIIANIFTSQFNYQISTDLKRKHRKPQSRLSAHLRQDNIKNSFFYKGESLKEKSILLLDDVITTGSTINEAAKVLKEAGARNIIALTIFKS